MFICIYDMYRLCVYVCLCKNMEMEFKYGLQNNLYLDFIKFTDKY